MKRTPLKTKTPLKRKAGPKKKARKTDPRWEAVRKECFERAGHRCEKCNDAHSRLEAHHMIGRGEKTWFYDLRNLVCICWPLCHDHNKVKELWHWFLGHRKQDCLELLEEHPKSYRYFDWKTPEELAA